MSASQDITPPSPTGCTGLPPRAEHKVQQAKAEEAGRQASAAQHQAADPAVSVFVNANAGSGKTYLLVNRVIRLLLEGARPENILCITYTRAAAAEMRSRLFQRLAEWIHLDDGDLLDNIHNKLNQRDFPAERLPRARRLFALALETPGGLRVQTIHAFCERLLQAFPAEAGMPPGFEVMDEAETRELLNAARQQLLTGADDAVRDDLALLATHLSETELHERLQALLSYRRLLARMNEDDGFRQLVETALRLKRGLPEEKDEATAPDAFKVAWCNTLEEEELAQWAQRLEPLALRARDPRKPDNKRANDKTLDCLRAMLVARQAGNAEQAWQAARDWLLTGEGTPRATLLTSEVRKEAPDLETAISDLQESFSRHHDGYLARILWRANAALLHVGRHILQRYEEAKTRLGKFDYDDLILHTLQLLNGPSGPWVLYRLDGRIDHVLLDEAQDTSPEQWEILKAITEEFMAGEGAERTGRTEQSEHAEHAKDVGDAGHKEHMQSAEHAKRPPPRTIFAVGDVKQSIYSFQGAAPEAFRAMRDFFEKRLKDANLSFREVKLGVSFRTAQPILDVVDEVLKQPDFRLGEDDWASHQSARPHMPGFVELWPLEEAEENGGTDDDDNDGNDNDGDGPIRQALRKLWTPPRDLAAELRPQLRLAARIATTIRGWLDDGEALPPDPLKGETRPHPIRPRDILILVRQRTTLMEAIVSALKQQGIPVAGVDRLKVADHIAVQDMLALVRFLLLPSDDLSLAAALKSPLLERDDDQPFSDDDLLRLRGELFDFRAPLGNIERVNDARSLWAQLQDAAAAGAPVRRAVERLRRWRGMAGHLPPFEMLAHVLWRDGGLRRFISRLGTEALEPLEALLDLALRFERDHLPSLGAFIEWLQDESPEIKREQEGAEDLPVDAPGAVRVMTVHGAKGLEAPIVFLADTVSTPDTRKLRLIGVPISDTGTELPLWPMKKDRQPEAVRALVQQHMNKQEEEYNRLLYVAMTRAADRLYVCGARSGRGGGKKDDGNSNGKQRRDGSNRITCWHERIAAVLMKDELAEALPDGRTIWRYPRISARCRHQETAGEDTFVLPEWTRQPAPPERGPAVWLSPSRLPQPGADEAAASTAPPPAEPVLSPLSLASGRRQPQRDPFRRGVLIHKLLQYLPEIPPGERAERALEWLVQPAQGLTCAQAEELWQEVAQVLRQPRMAVLFGPASRAEVPFAAHLPGLDGQPLLVSGQIDRLAVLEDEVIVADFKSARPVPETVQDVPAAYVRQLALYAHAARQIWPDRNIRAALIYTAGPTWLELPSDMLQQALPG